MLCDQADVEHRLQIDITAEPEPVIDALIEAAQGHIEREYGGPIEEASYVGEKHTPAHRYAGVYLRHVPVSSIEKVTVDGVELSVANDIHFTSMGVVQRINVGLREAWGTNKLDGVVVDYTAGYAADAIPADIVDVCAWMVVNALKTGATTAAGGSLAGIKSEQIAEYGVEYFASVADPAAFVHMTDEQKDVIGTYVKPIVA